MNHKSAFMYIYIHMFISVYILIVVFFSFLSTTVYLSTDATIYVKAIEHDITSNFHIMAMILILCLLMSLIYKVRLR
jgi:hypothetical protein